MQQIAQETAADWKPQKRTKSNLRSYFLHWPDDSSRKWTHKKWLEAAKLPFHSQGCATEWRARLSFYWERAFLFLCNRKLIHACGNEVRLCRTSSQAAYPEEYSGWRGRGFQASLEWWGWAWQPWLSNHEFQHFQGGPMFNPKSCLLEVVSWPQKKVVL